jgi:hypothetical protein
MVRSYRAFGDGEALCGWGGRRLGVAQLEIGGSHNDVIMIVLCVIIAAKLIGDGITGLSS